MAVKDLLQPMWWFTGLLICTVIFELLHGAFKQEMDKLFTRWESSLHDVTTSEHSADLYWDLVDFNKELMKKSLNIFTFFAAFVVIMALLFRSNASGAILSFCLGIITYRVAIFNNWLGLKKYGVDKRPGKNAEDDGE